MTCDLKLDQVVVRVIQAHLPKSKIATKMDIVSRKTEVLRPTEADTVDEIEKRLNEWKEAAVFGISRRSPLKDDQRKSLLISILPVMLKSAAMR